MGVVSVSMPKELLDEIDQLVEAHNYSGRSEVVRDAGRKLVSEFENTRLEGEPLAAVITVLYPYGETEIETALTENRHEHSERIRSNAHSCLGDDQACIETFTLEGNLETISGFVRELEAISERIQVDHSLYPLDGIDQPGIQYDS